MTNSVENWYVELRNEGVEKNHRWGNIFKNRTLGKYIKSYKTKQILLKKLSISWLEAFEYRIIWIPVYSPLSVPLERMNKFELLQGLQPSKNRRMGKFFHHKLPHHTLDIRNETIATLSFAFSRASGSLLVSTWSPHWLLMTSIFFSD